MLVIGALAAPHADAQENLLVNPSFENGWTGWQVTGSVSVVEGGHSGQWCARVIAGSIPDPENPIPPCAGSYDGTLSQSVPVTPGARYTLQFWAAGYGKIYVEVLINDVPTSWLTAGGAWAHYSMTALAPDNATTVGVRFWCDWPSSECGLTTELFVDDVSLTARPVVPCCREIGYLNWSCVLMDSAACLGSVIQDCADCKLGSCYYSDYYGSHCEDDVPKFECVAAGGIWSVGSCNRQRCTLTTEAHPELSTDSTTAWEISYHLPQIPNCCHVTSSEMCFFIRPCPLFDPDPPRTQCLGTYARMCFEIDDSGGSLVLIGRQDTQYVFFTPGVMWSCSACLDGEPDGFCPGYRGEFWPPGAPVPTHPMTWGRVKALYR
jgi:hypothetical protein